MRGPQKQILHASKKSVAASDQERSCMCIFPPHSRMTPRMRGCGMALLMVSALWYRSFSRLLFFSSVCICARARLVRSGSLTAAVHAVSYCVPGRTPEDMAAPLSHPERVQRAMQTHVGLPHHTACVSTLAARIL